MSTRTRLAGILTAITMTAVLAACSSGTSDDSSASDGAGSAADAPAGVAEPAPAQRDGTASTNESGSSGATDVSSTPLAERAVISTGTVSLQSKDVAAARREVQRVVDARGGSVTDEETETDDDGRTAYSRLVVRVPSARFDSAMQALEDAADLRSSNRGAEDVTTEVIDTDVRVRAQEASLKRVELLLSRAQSLKDIVWIESQLTSRQSELDSMKSQQAWLRDQTSLSTITVDITASPERKAAPPSKETEPAGFLTGLRGGTTALLTAGTALATIAGVLLPFAVVGLVLGLPLWLLVRRRRASRPQPAVGDA